MKLNIVSVVLAVVVALATAFSTQIQGIIGQHATISALVVGIWGVVAHFFQPPVTPSTTK